MFVSGIILAAGSSSRLGEPKQLLELDGRPLLQHVIDVASAARLDDIVVVVGHDSQRVRASVTLPANARAVFNPDYPLGQSTSLKRGLDAAHSDAGAAVIILGDQPRLRADTIRRVVEEFEGGDVAIVRARFNGVPGHPVVVARRLWPLLREIDGDRGARDLIAASPENVKDVEVGADAPQDVDTWQQYEELRRRS